MLTPANHSRLAALAQQPTLTPDDASFVQFLIRGNSHVIDGELKWVYPVLDDGYPNPNTKVTWHRQPIRKASSGGCAPNPHSENSRAPWIAEGKSRSYYYIRKTEQPKEDVILAYLPASLQSERAAGLKLYRACVHFCTIHKLDVNRLWVEVADTLGSLSTTTDVD